MDEVFDSSLDGYGTEEFLKIIKYVIKDANIFVISHKVGLEDRFDSVTRFEKVKGFSSIVKSWILQTGNIIRVSHRNENSNHRHCVLPEKDADN